MDTLSSTLVDLGQNSNEELSSLWSTPELEQIGIKAVVPFDRKAEALSLALAFGVRLPTVLGSRRNWKKNHFTTRLLWALQKSHEVESPLLVRVTGDRIMVGRPIMTRGGLTHTSFHFPKTNLLKQMLGLYALCGDKRLPDFPTLMHMEEALSISFTAHERLEARLRLLEKLAKLGAHPMGVACD